MQFHDINKYSQTDVAAAFMTPVSLDVDWRHKCRRYIRLEVPDYLVKDHHCVPTLSFPFGITLNPIIVYSEMQP